MNKSLISIIVPVFNVENHLDKCLNSLVNQSLKQIEILIVNDGSPDNSQTIIDHYVTKYPKLVKSFAKPNGGLGSARNFGLQQSKGEYIGFIDSDDYVKTDMFEKLYRKALKEDADLVIGEFEIVDEHGNNLGFTSITKHDDISNKDKTYALKYARNEAFNKLYHNSLFTEHNITFPSGWFEDYPTTALLIEVANKIAYVEDPLMYYVQRDSSIMGQTRMFSEKYFDILYATQRIINHKILFAPTDYIFFMDEVAPVHAFLKYFNNIIHIADRKERDVIIRHWGKELNRLLPGWHRSSAVKKRIKESAWYMLPFWKLIIYCFRRQITWPVSLFMIFR